MKKIKVLLVDDQPILLQGLVGLLSQQESFDIVGQANNGQQAIQLVEQLKPDVVLMDIRMPILNGVEATKAIKEKHEDVVIIILTTFEEDEYILEALAYGASGYLLKDIKPNQLIQAINDGYQGNILLPGKVAQRLSKLISLKQTTKVDNNVFTNKEKEVIEYLVLGYSNQEIAEKMYLSIGTIKNYISQIYAKANVSDRANAIVYFKNQGY